MIDAWLEEELQFVLSAPIFDELRRALGKRYFSRRLAAADRASCLDLVRGTALFMQIIVEVKGIASHPEDDLVIATAVSARVPYLVTGDHKLQSLKRFDDVTIVGPREFLERVLGGKR